MTCLPTWRCGVDVRLTLRLKEGERLEWEAAAGADVPLSRFVKRVVNEHVRHMRTEQASAALVRGAAPVRVPTIVEIDHADGSTREIPVKPAAKTQPAPYSTPESPDAKTAFKADPKQVQQIRDLARDLAGTSGKCSADAPRGTVCKVCGKKH